MCDPFATHFECEHFGNTHEVHWICAKNVPWVRFHFLVLSLALFCVCLSVVFWACGLFYWYIGCLSIASECNISPTLFVARTGTRISPANMRIQCMYSMRTIICISVCVLCRVVALQFTLFCMEQLYYYSVQCIMCLPRILMWIRIQFIKFAFCPLKFPSDTRRQNGQSCSNVVVKAFWETGKKSWKTSGSIESAE